jgi:hypothetical protein
MARIFCRSCGTALKVFDPTCPKCGSQDRHILVEDSGEGWEEMKLQQKNPTGFLERTIIHRSKRAGRTGRKAEEKLTIDRTSETETVKIHKVWEENEEGQLVEEHDETKSFSAKHRPRTK